MTKLSAAIWFLATAILVAITQWSLLGQYSPTGQLEVAAVSLSGLCVWMAVKNSIWTWPVGIAGTICYGVLFYQWALYADMGLQVFYTVIGFVGWVTWHKRRVEAKPEARRIGWVHLTLVILAIVAVVPLMRDYLISINGAAPFWDALLSTGSIAAQYLLIRKYIENWYVWALLDVAYIALFYSRDLYLTSALYVGFLAMVIMAAFEWRQYLPKKPVETVPGDHYATIS